MHFHLPKPLHGWREFAGEVGIIVIGVLIALGAEQVVETVHVRREAGDAERRIRSELVNDTALQVERVAIQPCLTQRIGVVAQGLASGRTDWSSMVLPPMPERPTALREMYHIPVRNWVTDAYREALTQGDLNSVDPKRRGIFAGLYKQIDHLAELNQSEQQLNAALAPLQFNPALSSGDRNQMIATLARLDAINGLIVLISKQNFGTVGELGFTITRKDMFDEPNRWSDEIEALRKRYGNCVDGTAITQYESIARHRAIAG